MTSLRSRLRACVAGLSVTSVLVLSACPAGDDTAESGGVTIAGTTTTGMTDTGMEAETTETPGDSTGSGADLSHAADIQPIWDAHCVEGCHAPGGEWGFLLDMSGDAYDAIVGVAAPQLMSLNQIEPNEPEESYIWHKIQGTQAAAGGSGLTMPKARMGEAATVMTQEEIDTIKAWIEAGAPE